MRSFFARAAGVVLAAAGLAAGGCSGGPAFAPVGGTVTRAGKPLGNVQVEFWSEVSGPRSLGVTDDAGKYTLTSDDGSIRGAVVGPHKVVLVDLAVYEKLPMKNSRDVEKLDIKPARFGPQYSDPNKTTIRKTVEGGKPNTVDIDVGP